MFLNHGSSDRARRNVSLRDLFRQYPLGSYVALAYGLSWMILVPVGLAVRFDVVSDEPGPLGLLALIAPFGPAIAAFVVTAMMSGRPAVRQLRQRLFQWRVGMLWYLLVLFGIPVIELLGAFAVLGAVPIDDLGQNWSQLFTHYLPLVMVTLVLTGLAEEPGWRGFALPRLQSQHGPLLGTAILAMLWATWHLPNLLFGGWSTASYTLWILATISSTFIYTWVYNRTDGSILVAMLLHSAINTGAGLVAWLLPAFDESGDTRLYGALAVAFSTVAVLLALATGGSLGYHRSDTTKKY